ncbi:hypothetical protein TSOC_001888 [Tetrabaena socialis]|uniref:Uncharacterized protein n=1 Tax=Tetrabaena socialis TaxID=47790 RepID=A0A2J8AFG4_9CHLO|nr:hypothetical protein TSOC_001888 [Tetrabaena socialis]|eukprot:PNH11265.1 hypothetical protein TSOC_001888 [Tetrabaena socialis]
MLAMGISVDFAWDADGNVLPPIGGLRPYWPTLPVGDTAVCCMLFFYVVAVGRWWAHPKQDAVKVKVGRHGGISTTDDVSRNADRSAQKPKPCSAAPALPSMVGGATSYEPGETKQDGTVSTGTRAGKGAGGKAKGGAKGQGARKGPSNFPLALGFATWHHEPCGVHNASTVTKQLEGTATFNIKCPRTGGGCGVLSRVADISNVVEYPTLKEAQDALARDRSACSKCTEAKAQAAAGLS